jgi:hypothetical protein
MDRIAGIIDFLRLYGPVLLWMVVVVYGLVSSARAIKRVSNRRALAEKDLREHPDDMAAQSVRVLSRTHFRNEAIRFVVLLGWVAAGILSLLQPRTEPFSPTGLVIVMALVIGVALQQYASVMEAADRREASDIELRRLRADLQVQEQRTYAATHMRAPCADELARLRSLIERQQVLIEKLATTGQVATKTASVATDVADVAARTADTAVQLASDIHATAPGVEPGQGVDGDDTCGDCDVGNLRGADH